MTCICWNYAPLYGRVYLSTSLLIRFSHIPPWRYCLPLPPSHTRASKKSEADDEPQGERGPTAERKESEGTDPGRVGPLLPKGSGYFCQAEIPHFQPPLVCDTLLLSPAHTPTLLWVPGPLRKGGWQRDGVAWPGPDHKVERGLTILEGPAWRPCLTLSHSC